MPHQSVLDADSGEPTCRRRLLDRGLVELFVQGLLWREASAKEHVAPGDRDPRHVVEDLVHADPDPGVRVRKGCARSSKPQNWIARAWVDLRTVDDEGRVPAPAAGLGADLMELGDGADLDRIGKERVIGVLRGRPPPPVREVGRHYALHRPTERATTER